MSWAYQSKATVWPFLGRDDWDGTVNYGIPYTIDCTYKDKSEIRKDSTGREFVTIGSFYTDDDRVKRSDYIILGDNLTPTPSEGSHEVNDVRRFTRQWRGLADKFEVII